MPLYSTIKASEFSSIHFWKLHPDLDNCYKALDLDIETEKEWKKFHPKRQLELLNVNLAIQELLPTRTVAYTSHGKPYFSDSNDYLSISHCADFVALSVSSLDVGIDLENQEDKCLKIQNRFLNTSERNDIGRSNASKILAAWCAKEAIYKASGTAGLKFREQILLPTFAQARETHYGIAFLDNSTQNFELFSGTIQGITWVLAELKTVHEAIGLQ